MPPEQNRKKKIYILNNPISKLMWHGMEWKGRRIWKWVYKWKMKNNMFEALKTIWNNKCRDSQNYCGILLYQISRLIKNLYEIKQMWQNEKIDKLIDGQKQRVQKQACIYENLLYVWKAALVNETRWDYSIKNAGAIGYPMEN